MTVAGDHFDPVLAHACDGKIVDFADGFFLISYDDGDTETMRPGELWPFVSDLEARAQLKKHLRQYTLVLTENKSSSETNEFVLDMEDKIEFPDTFFGIDAASRRKLCWETHNICIFKHQLSECRCHEGVQVYRRASAEWRCFFNHDPAVCKCDREVRVWSQDEATYHAYILGSKVWSMQRRVALNKKSTGPGCNVSAACNEVLGEGFKPGPDVINRVNQGRRDKFYRNLPDAKCRQLCEDEDVFMRLMMIGVAKDGWWGLEDLIKQSEDFLDCLEAMDDPYQHVCWFDQSVAHHRKSDHALIANKMNVRWGGAQPVMREAEMTAGCVGDCEATLHYRPRTNNTRVDRVKTNMVFDDPSDMSYYTVDRVAGAFVYRHVYLFTHTPSFTHKPSLTHNQERG